MRSIKNKTFKLNGILPIFTNIPDIIILTETWLNHCISDSELNLNDFIVYRSDRSPDNNGNTVRGGGVLIAVKKNLESAVLASSRNYTNCYIEELYIEITTTNKPLIIGAIYFTHSLWRLQFGKGKLVIFRLSEIFFSKGYFGFQ